MAYVIDTTCWNCGAEYQICESKGMTACDQCGLPAFGYGGEEVKAIKERADKSSALLLELAQMMDGEEECMYCGNRAGRLGIIHEVDCLIERVNNYLNEINPTK